MNLLWVEDDFKLMSKLVMFNVEYCIGDSAKGKDNVLKAEWLSVFPSLRTVTIFNVDGYKFDLEALVDTMQSVSHSVTVIVVDRGEWAQRALTDEVAAAFGAIGWDTEYDGKCKNEFGHEVGGLIIKSKM